MQLFDIHSPINAKGGSCMKILHGKASIQLLILNK